jgi:hypothetical protein
VSDRTEEHRPEPTASAGADDHHVGRLGNVEQRLRRSTFHEPAVHAAGHSLTSELDSLVDDDRGVDLAQIGSRGESFAGHPVGILPGVQNEEVYAVAVGFVDGPIERRA